MVPFGVERLKPVGSTAVIVPVTEGARIRTVAAVGVADVVSRRILTRSPTFTADRVTLAEPSLYFVAELMATVEVLELAWMLSAVGLTEVTTPVGAEVA